ncbi:DUF3102 domain-containing protein [Carnobacterium sp. PL17GRE32]|uniref:DUF3102 domain-containing protein n=1 Tax=Carnobacterium sp. PL17GRE32 TaxID=2592355 RepID=UPI0011EBCC0B|nr:DUF3102 domain-containing protein [Carnobacterium sp. PL17GRE32]KAF3306004.1 DUF3102 domain-containing protein [Carnobacterium sp. PL17GRE32]
MNEITLSNDLNQIELEINHHKNIAGQSIWEIGRRLNHVKENDLVHGQFTDWIEGIGINHSEANRMMRIANELPNSSTLTNLGSTALYLITTLPEEEKQEELSKAKSGDPSTVRELRELKKQLQEKDQQLEEKENQVNQLHNQILNTPPQLVQTKEVIKEVKPHDYDNLKSDVQQLGFKNKELEKQRQIAIQSAKHAEQKYNKLLEERKAVDEKSEKYDQLTEAIENAKGDLDHQQKLISNYKSLMKLLREINDAILKASGLVYLDLSEIINTDSLATAELQSVLSNLERLTKDISTLVDKPRIIEGEFING